MIYRACKMHYVNLSIIPAGALAACLWYLVKMEDIESTVIIGVWLLVLSAICIYAGYRQSKTPLVEIDEHQIKIHDVRRSPQTTPWGLVAALKKGALFGYRLETLKGDIWLPTGLLTKKDVESVLNEINEHLKGGQKGGDG